MIIKGEPLIRFFFFNKKKRKLDFYLFHWLTREAAKHAERSRFLQGRIPHHTETITTKWIIKDLECISIYSLYKKKKTHKSMIKIFFKKKQGIIINNILVGRRKEAVRDRTLEAQQPCCLSHEIY